MYYAKQKKTESGEYEHEPQSQILSSIPDSATFQLYELELINLPPLPQVPHPQKKYNIINSIQFSRVFIMSKWENIGKHRRVCGTSWAPNGCQK